MKERKQDHYRVPFKNLLSQEEKLCAFVHTTFSARAKGEGGIQSQRYQNIALPRGHVHLALATLVTPSACHPYDTLIRPKEAV